ncbi:hypothetical protein BS47DRAFT_1369343 [Hydnum rufescens UP504]|uniref:Uncharacterized protein n=1 Tax=Hydnum rufescens UP504 TaxID=1448309 RepID=A0A9P6DH40_9AGAM|nr:hypothetical protein BS47DRAFT_1369343 [Hydnum rufescens UP504]
MNEIQHHTPAKAGPLHYAKAHPKKANETHGEIQMCAATQGSIRGPSPQMPAMDNIWYHTPAAAGLLSIHASHGPNTQTVCHEGRTHGATHPLQQAPFPSVKPHLKPAQTKPKAKHQFKYDTTHPLQWVFSPTTKPHLPEEYIDKAQGDIWARVQPRKNSMLDYPQYNNATHPPKRVPPLHDTPPSEDHTCCGGGGLPSMHETPPDKNTAKVQDQKRTGNTVPHTHRSGCVVIPGPSPQTPATSETTGKAPGPLQKIMPETGWVMV